MIHKYKKIVPIEAEQFNGSIEMARKYNIERGDTGAGYEYYLPTNEGDMAFNEGDYIATGVDGEHWCIAKDIFERTYERCD
ncbi:MAG: hypothetical protein SOV64_06890 [Limosilactobacillus reuteri]|nr:hypothetical protein [Limosilactobacillus reuteri]